jgi:hypothetical protein
LDRWTRVLIDILRSVAKILLEAEDWWVFENLEFLEGEICISVIVADETGW